MNLHGVSIDTLLQAATNLVTQPLPSQACDLQNAAGRTLATPITADRDLPPFNRSAMDGYALRFNEYADAMACVGRIDAGANVDVHVPKGGCVSIATGARVPDGLDTVVQHEWTTQTATHIAFNRTPSAYANVHLHGADATYGDVVFDQGEVLNTVGIALAAACGCTTLSVHRQPRIAVCTSGDEVVPASSTPQAHHIRNSNGPMVAQLVNQLGGVVHDTRHLNDDADSVLAPLADLIAPADIIVTTGGISAGDRDILAAAFDDLGVTWTVIGATVKPGRPIRLGIIGETIVVCLPGNPVSALVMGALVLGRVINALLARPAPLWTPAELDCDVHPNARRTLVRPCCLKHGRLHIPQWQGSGDLVHLAPTHGVVRIPMQEATIAKGTPLPFLPWP